MREQANIEQYTNKTSNPGESAKIRLKHLAQINPTKSEVSNLEPDTEVSFVALENFGTDGDIKDSESRKLGKVYDGYTYFREGDIAIAKITPSFENGKGAICRGLKNDIGFGTTELHVLRPRKGVSTEYLWYLLRSKPFMDEARTMMRGVAGQQRVPSEFLESYCVPCYELKKQDRIAGFLKSRIDCIDTILEKNEEISKVLKEKDGSMTTHAITGGLHTGEKTEINFPWIDSIPTHWDMIPLKYASPEVTVGIVHQPSKYYSSNGVPGLRSLNVGRNELREDELVYINEPDGKSLEKSRVFAGDLITVRSGDPGRTTVVPERFSGSQCVDLLIIRDPTHFLSEYLSYAMNSEICRRQFQIGTEGAAQKHFNVGDAKELLIPRPPIKEQEGLVKKIKSDKNTLHRCQSYISETNELLREKRQALITAAVTGQIDVADARGVAQELD